MSRIRKAGINAGFTYAQIALGMAAGLIMVPLTLAHVGTRHWGLWLATGELLAYAAMMDLGVLSVLPWMVAEADGRQDREAMRRFLVTGLAVGLAVGVAYAGVSLLLWEALPHVVTLTAADRTAIGRPLAVLVAVTAATYPLRVFRALLYGLQDAFFNGLLAVGQALGAAVVTAVLLVQGYGLLALALGLAAPTAAVAVVSVARAVTLAPDLFAGWRAPARSDFRFVLTNGAGAWLAAIGWQLLAASNAMLVTWIGRPEWVAVYACTAKLSTLGTQLAWVLPDSGLVGLAQLHGERCGAERLRAVVLMMLRLHLLLSSVIACGLLAFNPSFVAVWVGPGLFGGLTLNALLAAGVVLSSIVHGLTTTAAVMGNRLHVGVLTLCYGFVQTTLAVALGRVWGLTGIAGAAVVAAVALAIPVGILLLRPATALTSRDLAASLFRPWLVRVLPILAVAATVGAGHRWSGLPAAVVLSGAVGAALVWHMRPLYVGLPIDSRMAEWLVRVRLLPGHGIGSSMPAAAGGDR
jgi:hypothetical protein